MRRALLLLALALVMSLVAPLAAQPRALRDRVVGCLGTTAFDGFTRMRLPPDMEVPELVAITFMRRPQTININVQLAPDLAFARAQYRYLGRGQSEGGPSGLSHRGVQVRGRAAQRTWYPTTHKSEVGMILADRFDLRMAFEPAQAPDDVLPYAERLDLDCLERAAR